MSAAAGALQLSRPEHDGGAWHGLPRGVTVRGGAGGTTAMLEDLVSTARALEAVASALDDAGAEARKVLALVNGTAGWSPGTAWGARAALEPLMSTATGLLAQSLRLRTLASGLRQAVELYQRADLDAAALLRIGLLLGASGLGEAGPTAWVATGGLLVVGAAGVGALVVSSRLQAHLPTPAGFLLRALTGSHLRDPGPAGVVARTVGGPGGPWPAGFGWPTGRTAEQLVPVMAAFLRSAAPGRAPFTTDPVPEAALLLSTGARGATLLLGAPTSGLLVGQVVQSGAGALTPPRSAAALLVSAQQQYPVAGGTPGSVVVHRYDHPDGTRSWAVGVPGTQNWSPIASENPNDLSSGFQLMAEQKAAAEELVIRAMDMAGVEPGEPVVVVGHSLGGMAVTEIASDPALAERFTVAAVVTAGSPVARIDVPAHVQALHLESTHDVVPALDGRPNPDVSNRVTVTVDLTQRSPAEVLASRTPAAAHDGFVYAEVLAAVERSDDPSIRSFLGTTSEVFGGPGTVVTTQVYQGCRYLSPSCSGSG